MEAKRQRPGVGREEQVRPVPVGTGSPGSAAPGTPSGKEEDMGKIKGKADQVKGKVKEETGAAAGDTGLEMKGKAEKTKGRLEENASDAAARIRRMSEGRH